MYKKLYLLASITLITVGVALVGAGVWLNLVAIGNSNTLASSQSPVQNLGNGLEGKIYLENNDLSEDVESRLVVEVSKATADLKGFSLQIKTPSDMMLYCNGIKYTAGENRTTNSFVCNGQEGQLNMTLDVTPTPPFNLQIRTLNRKTTQQATIEYTISNVQGVITQDKLQVVSQQSPASSANHINWLWVWYGASIVYILMLAGYLIYRKKVAKNIIL